jgi:hypothetical protein
MTCVPPVTAEICFGRPVRELRRTRMIAPVPSVKFTFVTHHLLLNPSAVPLPLLNCTPPLFSTVLTTGVEGTVTIDSPPRSPRTRPYAGSQR